MEKYGTLVWILVAIFAILLVIKFIKKTAGLLVVGALLIISGLIPFSTVKEAVDTTAGGYESIKQQAALWSIEENANGDGEKILYIFNSLPVTLEEGKEFNDEEILTDLVGGQEQIDEVNKYLDDAQEQIEDKTGIDLDKVSGDVAEELSNWLTGN